MKRKVLGVVLAFALIMAVFPAHSVHAAPSEATLAAVHKAYYDILRAAVNESGYVNENTYTWYKGIFYAELIDFDNDGIPELIYASMPDAIMPPVISVYGYLGEATLLFTEQLIRSSGPATRSMIAMGRNNEKYLHIDEHSGPYTDGSIYYTVNNGNWIEVL